MSCIIGIDIGTTHTKAVAFTDKGEVLASALASYPVLTAGQGAHELDPGQLLQAFFSVLREVLQKTGFPPAGISFSCAMHSVIVVDTAGKPLTAAITWADLRSRAYAEKLKGSPEGKRIYRQTGTPVHAMSPLCKLLWLKDKKPAIFGQAFKFISIKEYIWWHLTGKYQVDHSIASTTGLFDIYNFSWYPGALELAGITAEQLSDPVPCTHIETEAAGAAGVIPYPGLPLIIGGSDGCLANLGSLATREGETALTIGTSGAVRMISHAPQYDPQERIFHYVLERGLYVSGGATNNGGGVAEWFAENFSPGGNVTDALREADAVAPGSEGLVFLPYLQGERAPIWDANASGVFFGIRSSHERRHFMRAVMEGIGFSLLQIGASLEETIGPIKHISASGGFIRSRSWLQMIADIFNREVRVMGTADASAVGACLMGFYALGIIGGLQEAEKMIRVEEIYRPNEAGNKAYQPNLTVYNALYGRLKDLM